MHRSSRPEVVVGGQDAYPDVWTKTGALPQSIVGNHALIDGNKRLGWLATAVFLEINDESVADAHSNDVYGLVMSVAAGRPPLENIAEQLRKIATKRDRGRRVRQLPS